MNSIRSLALLVVVSTIFALVTQVGLASSIRVASSSQMLGANLPSGVIMPWFCLQRCDNTTIDQIKDHVNQIIKINQDFKAGKSSFKVEAVAFERYNLGEGGTVVKNPESELFDLNKYLMELERDHHIDTGIKYRVAMVSSFPYPPQILNWTRALMQDQKPFIEALRKDLIENDIHGINLDLEPTNDATTTDGVNYAALLRKLKLDLAGITSLHQPQGKFLTVAAATWGKLWNMPLMAEALRPEFISGSTGGGRVAEGYLTSMNTYTITETTFLEQVTKNMQAFKYPPYDPTSPTKGNTTGSLVTGLGAYGPSMFPSTAQVVQHFDVLEANNLCQIALWKAPIPANMMPSLETFGSRCIKRN